MRKVKIVCTIGPATSSIKVIDKMIRAGMNVARMNFSHGTYEEHKRAIHTIRQTARKYDAPVALLQDLKGLKIRVGAIKDSSTILNKGATLTITTKKILGDNKQIQVSYPDLIKDVNIGDNILFNDGLLQLKVIGREKDQLQAKVLEGGLLRERKGVNLPGTKISGTVFTKKDREDLSFGISMGIDYVAMSFVRSKGDILRVKGWLKKQGADIPVIAKIENRQALDNIDEIIEAADGIMVARGDLGVELPPETVPLIQKDLIRKCNAAMKPVITATQMLESMTGHMTPTRAEAADVANAVLDGTDALMLSAETSIGRYPVEALKMMDRIIRSTEESEIQKYSTDILSKHFAQALAESACSAATDINARSIVSFSRSGFTALLVSKFRPRAPIAGFTVSETMRRRMNLYWGTNPYVMKFPGNTDEMISKSEKILLQKGLAKKGDAIVIIASSPFELGGKSNIMKLHKVGY
ncbi:MAG: pyruvate kinase [Nitrospirae bacterium]|nr:pyruvate kinase [Nitrospirota bacterium]